MKNFIKISLITLTLLFAANANAQVLPISMGVKGGINSASMSGPITKSKSGFNAGLTLDVNLPANLAIMTGLEYTTKGTKFKNADNVKISANYLQIPAHLGYRIKVIPGLRLHVEAGPYFAQGIGGKGKVTLSDGKTVKQNTFGDDGYKRFDWGLGVGAGVTVLGKIQVRAGYDWGLASINRNGDSIRNKNFYTSVGLNFF